MGERQSKPNINKNSNYGFINKSAIYAYCEMQGWSNKMEDRTIHEQICLREIKLNELSNQTDPLHELKQRLSNFSIKKYEDSYISDKLLNETKDLIKLDSINNIEEIGIFGVFDGHNGSEVSDYLKENFKSYLLNSQHFHSKDYENALLDTFIELDKSLMSQEVVYQLNNKHNKPYDFDIKNDISQEKKLEEDKEIGETDGLSESNINFVNKMAQNKSEIGGISQFKEMYNNENNIPLIDINEDLENLNLTKEEVEEINSFKNLLFPRNVIENCPIAMFSGSTACLMLTVASNKNLKLYIAHIGDSKAFAYSNSNEEIHLTVDHKPTNIEEQSRVYKAGGEIKKNRVNNTLDFTRSFGDFEYKANALLPIENQVIIVIPDILKIETTSDINYFIIGSSGFFKYTTNKEIYGFINNILSKYQIKDDTRSIQESDKVIVTMEEYGRIMSNTLIELFDKLVGKESAVDNMSCVILKIIN